VKTYCWKKNILFIKIPNYNYYYIQTFKPVNQVYYGGGVKLLYQILYTIKTQAFMFKDKKDQIIVYIGIDTQKNFHVGVNLYWKNKIHKMKRIFKYIEPLC
jgi:hypothetical protein